MSKQYYGIDDFLDTHGSRNKRTLVVGSEPDRRELYQNCVGLDMQPGQGVDIVHNLNHPLPKEYGKFDHFDIVSVLEHCDKPWLVAETIALAANSNATLLISTPFVWRVHGYPSDYWRLTIEAYKVLFPQVEWVERGYLVGNNFKKITPSKTTGDKCFLQRSEAIGFGLFIF